MSQTRTFNLGQILSLIGPYAVADSLEEFREIVTFIAGQDVRLAALGDVALQAEPYFQERFPNLVGIVPPQEVIDADGTPALRPAVSKWMDEMREKYGNEFEVQQPPPGTVTVPARHPIEDLLAMLARASQGEVADPF